MTHYLGMDISKAIQGIYDSDGFPGIQVETYGGQQSGVAPYELHSPYGYLSIPHDVDTDDEGNPTVGCTVLLGLDGTKGHAWLGQDPRNATLIPKLTKGGSIQYGGRLKNPSFFVIDGDTGTQHIYVPYAIVNDVPTKAMTVEINVDEDGSESITILHGNGMSITMVAGGKNSITLKNAAGDARVEVNDEGTVISGQLIAQGGVSLGAESPLAAQPLVLAPPLLLILEEIVAALNIIALVPTVAAPTAGQLNAPISAIAAQIATIFTKNTKGL